MTLGLPSIVLLVGLGFSLVVGFRYLRGPRAKTRYLAMTVWASFGPYDTVERATEALWRAARAVFGMEELARHKKWIEGHARNFSEWHLRQVLERNLSMMCTFLRINARGIPFEDARAKARDEVISRGMAVLNELSEPSGYKWETAEQPDGTLGFKCKQVQTDEEVRRKEHEDAESIRNAVGDAILKGDSDAAHNLLSFLAEVHRECTGKGIETGADAGAAYHFCLEMVRRNSEAEFSRTFSFLNDCWLQIPRNPPPRKGYRTPLGTASSYDETVRCL